MFYPMVKHINNNYILLFVLFLNINYLFGQCLYGITSDTTQKNNEDPRITEIYRNNDGKIVYKKIYNKNFQLIAVDSFYYSGNYQLDSIIQYDFNGQRTPYYVKNEWMNGKLVKQFRAYFDGVVKRDTSILTYDASGNLQTFSNNLLKLRDIEYSADGNIEKAKIEVVIGNFRLFVDAIIEFDDKLGSFRELGLSDDLFSYFNRNNFVSIAPASSPNNPVVKVTYTYNSFGVVISAIRNEALQNTVISAKYGTDCREFTTLKDNIYSINSVYPNPVKRDQKIFVPKLQNTAFQVYNANGEFMFENYSQELEMNGLKEGLYLIKYLDYDKNSVIKKVVVN
jgi:hypothetical protein